MKYITTLVVACLSVIAFSQQTVTREIGDFDQLKVFDLIEVRLIQGDENKVVIKGEHTNDVRVINNNGKLKIRMHMERRFNGDETFVEVHYKSVEEIDANEGAYIVSDQVIAQNTLELRSQEGGRINVEVDVNHMDVKAVTGGSVLVTGSADSQDVRLNTGGIFQGRELETENTKISITAAGEADVNASETVNININVGGDVYVYGNPKEINKRRFAGGRIQVMD